MTESTLAPFLIRNFILPFFSISHQFKLLNFIRNTIISALLFLFKFIQSLIPNHNHTPTPESDSDGFLWVPFLQASGKSSEPGDATGDTCIARALHQLLVLINDIPVSSRKYEVVRSYAEKLLDENLKEGCEPLRRVNATVLSGAFARALGQLEVAVATAEVVVVDEGESEGNMGVDVEKKRSGYYVLNRVMKTVGYLGDAAWTRFTKRKTRLRGSAEKLSAELLWIAQKLAACGSSDEAVRQWASASKLASSSLSAHLRLQGSLVKLSVFLFKQAATLGGGEDDGEETIEELRKIKMKMLMSWLPFLCQASIGTDAPVLCFNEKTELENVLGELIGSLKHEEEQEKVLSLWLHYFSHCPSSDWPNLHLYYDRWCTASRNLLIHEGI